MKKWRDYNTNDSDVGYQEGEYFVPKKRETKEDAERRKSQDKETKSKI